VSSTSNPAAPPSWRRKRQEKRREVSAQRVANHRMETRRTAAARGAQGDAEAEWNILRAAIKALPDQARRDQEWKTAATVLRQLTDTLNTGHRA